MNCCFNLHQLLARLVTLLVLCGMGTMELKAQSALVPTPRFKNIETNYFESKEIKAISLTQNGILWIGTTKGLYQYAGNEISPVLLPAGVSSIINSLYEHQGYLYVGSNTDIFRIDLQGGQIQILPVLKKGDSVIHKYCMVATVNRQQELLFYTGYDTSAYFKYNLATQQSTFLFNRSDGFRTLARDVNGQVNQLWAVESTGLLEHRMKGFQLQQLTRRFTGTDGWPALQINQVVYDSADAIVWCSTNQGLLCYRPAQQSYQIYPLPRQRTGLVDLQLHHKQLYCATANQGIEVFDCTTLSFRQSVQHIPDDRYSLLQNNLGKIAIIDSNWLVAAGSKGLSILPLQPALQFTYQLKDISLNSSAPILLQQQTNTWLVANRQQLYFFNRQWQLQRQIVIPSLATITAIMPYQSDWIIATNQQLFLLHQGKVQPILPAEPVLMIRSVTFLFALPGTNKILAGGLEGLLEVDVQQGTYKRFAATDKEPYQMYQFAGMYQQQLLLNTYYSYTDVYQRAGSTSYKKLQQLETFTNIYDVLPIGNNRFLAATSNGVWVANLQQGSFVKASANFDATVYQFYIAQKDTLLITEKGLYHFYNNRIGGWRYPYNSLVRPMDKGNVSVYQDSLYFFQGAQLILLPLNATASLQQNRQYLNITSSKPLRNNQIEVTAADNKLMLQVSLNNFHPYGNAQWQYRLEPVDSGWQTSESDRLLFDNLAPGTYQLHIQSIQLNEPFFKETIQIVVQPNWYQTTWWKALLVVILGLTFLMVYRWNMRRFKRKSADSLAIRKQIMELESKAFRAQMNPHFIFNTLNSINSCILEKETEKASDYLTQFSRLIRLTLDNSNQDQIVLAKEIDTARLYVSIEQKRLDHTFDFAFHLDAILEEEEWLVPPMIIQPFIENAIWHGLVHKQPNGRIDIRITAQLDHLLIQIEDNGIGRKQAATLPTNKTLHQSYGTSITLQRLQAFHPDNHILYTDLINESKQPIGTLVQLTIYHNR